MCKQQQLFLSDLPPEILYGIFSYVSISFSDLICLSSACKRLRLIAKFLVFKRLQIKWNTIDSFLDQTKTNLIEIASFVNEIHLCDASLWGEWHKNEALGDLILVCTKAHSLHLSSSGSSSWLKYVVSSTNSNIAKLTVRAKPSQTLPTFNIHDTMSFPKVETLTIEGFNVFNSDYSISVSRFSLQNCYWEYPYEIQDICQNITELSIVLTPSFSYLSNFERIRSLAQSPPSTLTFLKLHFLSDPFKPISWVPLASSKACKRLKHVDLKGFDLLPLSFFQSLPSSVEKVDFHYKDASELFIERIKRIPKIKLSIISNETIHITL